MRKTGCKEITMVNNDKVEDDDGDDEEGEEMKD